MPEHVYLTPIPDSTSESIAFSSRNIPSHVVVPRSPYCTLLFCQSFQSNISTLRKHTLSAPARSTEHLRWLHAKSNRCATSAARPGRPPKVAAETAAEGKFLTVAITDVLKCRFWSECGRAKCFFSQSSIRNELIIVTQCSMIVCA